VNGKTTANQRPRRVAASALAAAVAALLTACSVSTSTSYPIGPAGSQTYRQVIAFVQCMRSHKAPGWTYPPPGGGGSLLVPPSGTAGPTAQAIVACKHLLPRGRENTNVVLG
jgi:hypothetical protein